MSSVKTQRNLPTSKPEVRLPAPGPGTAGKSSLIQEFSSVSEDVFTALVQRESTIASTQHLLSQQMFAYNVSKSDFNFRMAGEAVLNRYNSHDFRRDFPWKSMLDVESAKYYLPISAASDEVTRRLFKKWFSGGKDV